MSYSDAQARPVAKLAAVIAVTLLALMSLTGAALAQNNSTPDPTPDPSPTPTPTPSETPSPSGDPSPDPTPDWTPAPNPTPVPFDEPDTETGEADDLDGADAVMAAQTGLDDEGIDDAELGDSSFDGGGGLSSTPVGGVAAGAGGFLAGISGWVFAGIAALLALLYTRRT